MTEARQFEAVQRWFLGLVAGGFIIGGLILAFAADPGPDELAWGGILLRSGMILGAWWLVLPKARRVRPTTWASIGIVAAALALQPKLILWGVLVAVVVTLGSGWGRRARR